MKQPIVRGKCRRIFRSAFGCVPICLLLLLPRLGFGAVTVSGTVVNQTWIQANSPYVVVGDILVEGLTIEPGVLIHFQGNYVFEVAGVLTALGTEPMPIVFTQTNNAGGWQGIYFNSSAPGSKLEHCHIEGSINSGIRITNSLPVLRQCTIANNSSPSSGGGISADMVTGDLLIEDCTIANNRARFQGGGINAIMHGNTLRMAGCTVSGNIANPTNAAGTYLGGGIRVEGDSSLNRCVISNNVCNSCAETFAERQSSGGGIYSSAGHAVLRNCLIRNNQSQAFCCGSFTSCRAYGGGFYLDSGSLTALNCILLLNIASGGSSSIGGGVYIDSGALAVNVVNCSIAYNNTEGLAAAGGTVMLLNSILYFNANGGAQISGMPNVTYSDVQGGFPGTGNKDVNPVFESFANLRIVPGSPCIDMGDPSLIYNDTCRPPSLGTVRNDMGAHGGPGGCCWSGPCSPPEILTQPQSQVTCIGRDATFCVTAEGDQPLSYQWRSNGVDITGATDPCYTISNVQSNSAGNYSVIVANFYGSITSSNAPLTVTPACLSIDLQAVSTDLYARLTIEGVVGQTYRVEYVLNLMETNNWIFLTNIFQATPEIMWTDTTEAVLRPSKFYRVIPVP